MLSDPLMDHLKRIYNQRHKLLFIVENNAPDLDEILARLKAERIPIVNVNLVLADQLRRISAKDRPFAVKQILRQYLDRLAAEIVCFRHIEYLFDPELSQDPVRLFESLSGNRILIVIWPGQGDGGILRYASPEHPEFYQNGEYAYGIYPIEAKGGFNT
ncbi:BREX-3 system P-loop-containing protein BrxF [Bacillaceae bacterium]